MLFGSEDCTLNRGNWSLRFCKPNELKVSVYRTEILKFKCVVKKIARSLKEKSQNSGEILVFSRECGGEGRKYRISSWNMQKITNPNSYRFQFLSLRSFDFLFDYSQIFMTFFQRRRRRSKREITWTSRLKSTSRKTLIE